MSLATAKLSAVSAWNLNEASGNRADSVGSKTLTDNNTVGSAVGKFGNSAVFVDSNTEYFYTSFTPPSGNTWTISLWIKTSSNNRQVCGWDDNNSGTSGTYDRWIYLDSGGTITFFIYDGVSHYITSTATVNDGNWHSVVCCLDAGTMKMYIDGSAEADTEAATNGYNGYSTPFFMVGKGTSSGGTGSFIYNGDLDDIVILDGYAIGVADASELWDSGNGVPFSGWGAISQVGGQMGGGFPIQPAMNLRPAIFAPGFGR